MTEERQLPSVVVVGGGYAGTAVAKALDERTKVTLVEPKDAFVHNVAALRAAVDPLVAPQIFLPYDRLLAHGEVLRDRAVRVDGTQVELASGRVLRPDFIVLATGSTYPYPAKSDRDDSAEAIARYRHTYEQLGAARRVMLLGAGAVGLEFAGEIAAAWPDKAISLVDQAPEILPGRTDRCCATSSTASSTSWAYSASWVPHSSSFPSLRPESSAPSPSQQPPAPASRPTSGSARTGCNPPPTTWPAIWQLPSPRVRTCA